ncbi:type II toxin-antitoxin system RelE/ParE family toxin [Wenyingzhuangia sp. IMCC45533]
MAKYSLTKKAVADLTSIWEYTLEEWSEHQADKYYEKLISTFEDISYNPSLGKNYEEIRKDLFGLKVKKHIVFYRKIENTEIEITRVLHGRMNLKNKLK